MGMRILPLASQCSAVQIEYCKTCGGMQPCSGGMSERSCFEAAADPSGHVDFALMVSIVDMGD